jgi:predicted outer membrane lipoprotein
LSDRFGLPLPIRQAAAVPPGQPSIVIGTAGNPLVRARCAAWGVDVSPADPGPEEYALHACEEGILVAGSDDRGAFYGLQTLRQLLLPKGEPEGAGEGEGAAVPGARVRDRPHVPFRGIRLYLPGRENLPFFRRFVRDFCALFKFNTLILEVNACMRLHKHPELNAGSVEFARDMDATRRSRPTGPRGEGQDSAHHDAADGGILEQDEVAELVRYARRHHIEVIPEIPSLTHAYYLLARHRELAEVPEAEWPDTYCPSCPESYALYFDVLDEYIAVMQPRTVHIGHDEWRMPVEFCPRCRNQDHTELFVQDVHRIHGYLSERGIRVAMWGDHLLESVRNVAYRHRETPGGTSYRLPGALSPQQVAKRIPKDILVLNWFWEDSPGWLAPGPYRGEENDLQLQAWGFEQVYGNLTPGIEGWPRRSRREGVLGGAPSSWAATDEFNLGKDLVVEFLGCANLFWSGRPQTESELRETARALMPTVRRGLSGRVLPSAWGLPVSPVDLSRERPASVWAGMVPGGMLRDLQEGEVQVAGKTFQLAAEGRAVVVGVGDAQSVSLPPASEPIALRQDASSLLFLLACAFPGENAMAYQQIYDMADTAELLGWVEVTYEDGYVLTVPLRYGVNVSDWERGVVYGADAVDCAGPGREGPAWFYALEWANPRLGRAIDAVRLVGAPRFTGTDDKRARGNVIALLGLSVVGRGT